MAWRFDESIARPMQDLESVGLNENDVTALTQAFLVCGFWRAVLDEGLFFFTAHSFKIFELEPHDGAVNIATFIPVIHQDDRAMVLDSFQRAIETKQSYQVIYRLNTRSGSIKWVRTVGHHHLGPSGAPEIRGMTHELFQHVPTAAFVVEPSSSQGHAEHCPNAPRNKPF